jgi:hypothetical protein
MQQLVASQGQSEENHPAEVPAGIYNIEAMRRRGGRVLLHFRLSARSAYRNGFTY